MTILGLDGSKGERWVVATSDLKLKRITFNVVTSLDTILQKPRTRDQVAVLDIPIGLCSEERECDKAARQLLRPHRHNSVFSPPCPEACKDAATSTGTILTRHQSASDINRQHTTRGISRQAFSIAPRIWEVNRLITKAHQASVREGHPEVSFALMNGCRPLAHHKATRKGQHERLALLRAHRMDVDPSNRSLPGAAEDDIIDAAAMLWTAWRVHRGIAVRLPADKVQRGARGLEMAIWA